MDLVNKIKTEGFDSNVGDMEISITAVTNTSFEDGKEVEYNIEGVDEVNLCEEKTNLNGTSGIEGQLLVSKIDEVKCIIDEVGNFVISGKDCEKYEIDEDGNLIYNY